MTVKLVPELNVDSLEHSLAFYVDLAGFSIRYQRPEDRFAYIERDGVELMMEETFGPGRRWHPAPLEHPYGRGINFQIEIKDATTLHGRLRDAGRPFILDLEENGIGSGIALRVSGNSSSPTRTATFFASVKPSSKSHQNRKYRCAIGKTSAGAQVRSSPSALTS